MKHLISLVPIRRSDKGLQKDYRLENHVINFSIHLDVQRGNTEENHSLSKSIYFSSCCSLSSVVPTEGSVDTEVCCPRLNFLWKKKVKIKSGTSSNEVGRGGKKKPRTYHYFQQFSNQRRFCLLHWNARLTRSASPPGKDQRGGNEGRKDAQCGEIDVRQCVK